MDNIEVIPTDICFTVTLLVVLCHNMETIAQSAGGISEVRDVSCRACDGVLRHVAVDVPLRALWTGESV